MQKFEKSCDKLTNENVGQKGIFLGKLHIWTNRYVQLIYFVLDIILSRSNKVIRDIIKQSRHELKMQYEEALII